jgi:hypothetical protein
LTGHHVPPALVVRVGAGCAVLDGMVHFLNVQVEINFRGLLSVGRDLRKLNSRSLEPLR